MNVTALKSAWARIFVAVLIVATPPALAARAASAALPIDVVDDPYLWLEDVTGEKALDWVRQQNAASTNELQSRPEFGPMRERLLAILNSRDRIPFATK